MYAKAPPDLRRTMASATSIEDWGKSALISAGRDGVITIHARRGQGLPYEAVPREELSTLWSLKQHGEVLLHLGDRDRAVYVDPVVSKADVRRALKQFEPEK
jgi:hypothetical protein